ncbi:putative reverse transcriptase zinc-binding domain-containing protein [Helianthus annuus]|nr:putative reverse transcriptase zinc-binding domain-containing protein [Helianthus annuus]KAJ0759036.1 putative reverse transcriptase zinc-binding domain-containing protein [Helianthus annuus]KAJ0762690.1 putative reverse transcriptase zinc-binding domain-containing protein [Helianthus annuus]
MQWESWIPIKVNVFAWRTEMQRIPTKLALIRRSIPIQNSMCVLCESVDEDVAHLFTWCAFSLEVWAAIERWCKIPPIMAFDFEDLLRVQDHMAVDKWTKKIMRGIIMTTCWAIWRGRNDKVFKVSSPKVADIIAMVKSWSFLWLRNRCKFSSIQWKEWVIYPMYMV